MNRVQRSSTEILVDTITINYNRRNLHEPLRQQKALTGPLRFWAVMLLLLGLVLFTLAFYSHVVVWRHTYLSSTEKGWTTLRAVWTWSIAWHRLPVISPFLLGPWGLAFAYFYLASRLRRRPNDRTAIVTALVLSILHTLGAAFCLIFLVLIGGLALTLANFSFQNCLILAACGISLAMVPGMIYTSMRLMDAQRLRVIRRVRPAPPVDALPDAAIIPPSKTDS